MRFLPYLTLQVSDVVTTGIAMTLGLGELNPLGFNPLTITMKMAVAAIISIIIQRGKIPHTNKVMTTLTGIVVIWNCIVLLATVIQRAH